MSGWMFAVLAACAWLFMARVCLRWSIEIPGNGANGLPLILGCLFLWWIGIPMMLSDRFSDRLSDQSLRKIAGESRRHKMKRLQAELKERERELGL